jgi:hypothetical protein
MSRDLVQVFGLFIIWASWSGQGGGAAGKSCKVGLRGQSQTQEGGLDGGDGPDGIGPVWLPGVEACTGSSGPKPICRLLWHGCLVPRTSARHACGDGPGPLVAAVDNHRR